MHCMWVPWSTPAAVERPVATCNAGMCLLLFPHPMPKNIEACQKDLKFHQ
jgi:hypothetical protein